MPSVSSIAAPAWASGVCSGLHDAGIRDVVYVPDNPLSHVLRVLGERFADVRTILATREEEAFGIAAGLYIGGRRPAVMLQSSGFGNSVNAVASLLLPYQIPVLMIISMRGDVGEWNAAQVPLGRALPHVLDALAIPSTSIDDPGAASDTIRIAATTAFSTRIPGACLLSRRMTTGQVREGR